MSRRPVDDPYRAVVQRFNRQGVHYIVVGMAGINYYARSSAEAFATMDYDIFVEPTRSNVEQAMRCLQRLGFEVATLEGPLTLKSLQAVVRRRRTVVATTPDGIMVELLLSVSGYAFADLARDAETFIVRGVPVKVGRLTKLVQSKKLAGRDKDRQFLQRYQSQLEE